MEDRKKKEIKRECGNKKPIDLNEVITSIDGVLAFCIFHWIYSEAIADNNEKCMQIYVCVCVAEHL